MQISCLPDSACDLTCLNCAASMQWVTCFRGCQYTSQHAENTSNYSPRCFVLL